MGLGANIQTITCPFSKCLLHLKSSVSNNNSLCFVTNVQFCSIRKLWSCSFKRPRIQVRLTSAPLSTHITYCMVYVVTPGFSGKTNLRKKRYYNIEGLIEDDMWYTVLKQLCTLIVLYFSFSFFLFP